MRRPYSSSFSPLCFSFFNPFHMVLNIRILYPTFIKRLSEARMLQSDVLSHRPPLQAVFCNFSHCAELMLLSVCEISSRFLRGDTLSSEVPIQHCRGQTVCNRGVIQGLQHREKNKRRELRGKEAGKQSEEMRNRRNREETQVRERRLASCEY